MAPSIERAGLEDAERAVLYTARMEARAHATVGQVAEGYSVLLQGRRHLEEIAGRDTLWVPGLLREYQVALQEYLDEWDSYHEFGPEASGAA